METIPAGAYSFGFENVYEVDHVETREEILKNMAAAYPDNFEIVGFMYSEYSRSGWITILEK